ncbi:partner and localizer of BRCA2 isoform 2-T2 [Leptodactylus fuscus]|uniref:partner and localizer of BRCA2 isoform X2 n=1 Tax=Leptodactylus fuscus TaxID=238119 RepID=UPI003F4E5363
MTAACDMEGVAEKHLSLEEKTKLKERLALLKKEYKKTVHRLQRSQRAERVKTHVKKTIEEQNWLLSQELSRQDSAAIVTDSLIDTNNASEKVPESEQSTCTPSADKERKPSVSFNLHPEILHCDKRSPSLSGSESSVQEPNAASKTEASGASNPNQGKRSRLKLNRSARRVCWESVSPSVQVNNTVNNIQEAGGAQGSAQGRIEDQALKIRESTCNSENTRRVQGCKDGVEVTNAPASPVFKKCLKEDSPTTVGDIEGVYPKEKVILDTGQSQEVTTDRSPDYSRAGNAHHAPPSLMGDHLPSCDVPQIMETTSTSIPSPKNESMTTSTYHGEPPSMEEERSPLDSCTLVEGLLFPVEYYVRTTRRMTSCQRKVDLEAVIHSHLGTARKGARGRPRRASTSSTPSLQVSDTPVSAPAHSATRSRQGRGRKSCPALVSSGLHNISKQLKFGSDPSPKDDGSQSVNGRFEEKEVNRKNSVRKQQETLQSQVYNLRNAARTDEPASSSHLFSGRLSLQNLLRHLDITDFHLPDEDFGALKLQKLKSLSLLEPFVPAKENKKYRRTHNIDNSTGPTSDHSALLHGEVEVCPSSQINSHRLLLSRGAPQNEQSLASSQAPMDDTVPAPQHDRAASQTFLTMETPAIFRPSPSKENAESCAPGFAVTHSLEQAPQCSADWGQTSNADVTKTDSQAPSGSLDPELVTSLPYTNTMETLSEGLFISSTNMESTGPIDNPPEPKPPPLLSPTKEVTCNVLLSTSLCSVPLDPTEFVSTTCTPGFPMIGSTPAVFSSPQCSSRPAPCEEPTSSRTIDFLPEESGTQNNEAEMVPKEDADIDQYSELLIPPSGGDTQGCAEKKPESQQADAGRSDKCNAEGLTGGDRLRLVSEIKDACAGSCPVDLCSVWWEFSGSIDLCIISASEYSVCLWRPQEVCRWKCVHRWNFTEMPVIQILPLCQEKNMVCVTLGNLEIMEIWVLSSHPELPTWEKQLVKCGQTKTAQGLSRHRVVSSSGGGDSQVVEVWQLSANGSVAGSHTLMAPKDSVVAFSEVDGEGDALVGCTVDNNLVLWNSVTGHLLSTLYIGDLCSDLTCISATSDSGLLFLVVGSLFSKSCEMSGNCIFKLIATNPQGGASTFIMAYVLPEGLRSRYLEGDVKKQRAAAVLSCGSIALWDLSRSPCSTVLPADPDTPWCLVRWGHRPSCLLAGRKDGKICVLEYTDRS